MSHKNSTGGCCFVCKKRYAYSDVQFFSFPWKKEGLLQKWFVSLELDRKPQSLQPTLYSRICSLHFLNSTLARHGTRVLRRPDAIPCLLTATDKLPDALPDTIDQPKAASPQTISTTSEANITKTNPPTSATDSTVSASVTSQVPAVPGSPQFFIICYDDTIPQTSNADTVSTVNADSEITINEEPSSVVTNSRKCRRNRLFPASCSPADSDSMARLKEKLRVLYPAYLNIKKKNCMLQQSNLRLQRKVDAMQAVLKDFPFDNLYLPGNEGFKFDETG